MRILTLPPWFVFTGYHGYTLGVGKRTAARAWREAVALGRERGAPVPGDGATDFAPLRLAIPAVGGMGVFEGVFMKAKPVASPPARLKLNILLQGNSGISQLGFAALGKGNYLSREYESWNNLFLFNFVESATRILLLGFNVVIGSNARAVVTNLRQEWAMPRTSPVRPRYCLCVTK